jgi:signal peptidase I
LAVGGRTLCFNREIEELPEVKLLRVFGIVALLGIVLMIALRLIGLGLQKYPGRAVSMQPTISPGDVCLSFISQSWATGNIKKGMIVFLHHTNYNYVLTKRIIAMERDTVFITGNRTYVNGEFLSEPYADYSDSNLNLVTTDSIIVGKGKLFVMGDNRGNSMDSRYPEFGLVDVQDVVGRPLVILWSEDKAKISKLLY